MAKFSRGGGRIPDDASAALGRFMITWAFLESIIEVGIHKQLGTDPVRSSIVIAGLQFKSKTSMLLALLHLEAKTNADAIKLVKTIMARSERNDLVHSFPLYSTDSYAFMRRKVDTKLKSTIKTYSLTALAQVIAEFEALGTSLAKALGVEQEEVNSFLHTAHNAANNSSG